jgi:hypothetical protein
MLPCTRETGMFVLLAITFVTIGRMPGAVQLRTREVELSILAEGKRGREPKARPAWIAGIRPTLAES